MTKLFAAIALAATVAMPAIAEEAPARSFTRDGTTYVYTATTKGDATVLEGRAYPLNQAFRLTVRGKRVNGRAGGVPVSFVAERAVSSPATALAAR